MERDNWVWSTYVSTPDFILPALTLGLNLQAVGSKFPLVVAMTSDVYYEYADLVGKMGCIPERINTVEYHEDLKNGFLKDHRLLNTSSRVSIFDLKQYEKMVFIDCDVLISRNVDELFDYPDGSMCSDNPERGGFEGLMVFIPEYHSYGIYPFLITHTKMMTDELFSELWFPIKSNPDYCIPVQYFYDFGTYYQYHQDDSESIKIYHCTNPKPWNIKEEDELYKHRVIQEYMKLYNQVKDKVREIAPDCDLLN